MVYTAQAHGHTHAHTHPHTHPSSRRSRGTGLRGKSSVAEQTQWRSLCGGAGPQCSPAVCAPRVGRQQAVEVHSLLGPLPPRLGGSGDWLHSWPSPRRSWSQAGVLAVASKVPRFQPPEPRHRTSGVLGQGTYHPVGQRVEEVEAAGENPGQGGRWLAP